MSAVITPSWSSRLASVRPSGSTIMLLPTNSSSSSSDLSASTPTRFAVTIQMPFSKARLMLAAFNRPTEASKRSLRSGAYIQEAG